MENKKRDIIIKNYIDKMPSLSTTVAKILEISNNPKTSPAHLNRIISLDPVLMGKVMRLINSAYYGIPQEITSLVRAIIMLGINTVKNLALSTAVLGAFGSDEDLKGLNMNGFWRHSLCVGVVAKIIAKKRKVQSKNLEQYFVAGLLHDIGKIPLNNKLSTDYVNTLGYSDMHRMPLVEAEKTVMGIDHTDVGVLIAKSWNLGAEIEEAIGYHHGSEAYSGEHREIVYSIVLANIYANIYEIGFSGDRFPGNTPLIVEEELGISIDDIEDIEHDVFEEIRKAQVFLKLAT